MSRPGYRSDMEESCRATSTDDGGQEIYRHERSKRGFGGEFVGRCDEPIEAGSDDEADVVAAHDVLDTGRGDRTCRC